MNPAWELTSFAPTSWSRCSPIYSADEESNYFLPTGLFDESPEASAADGGCVVAAGATARRVGEACPMLHAMADLALENEKLKEELAAERATRALLNRLLADRIQALIAVEGRIGARDRIRLSEVVAEVGLGDVCLGERCRPAAEVRKRSSREDALPTVSSAGGAVSRARNLPTASAAEWIFGETAESELSGALQAQAAVTLDDPFTDQSGAPRSGPHTPALDIPASGPCTPTPRDQPPHASPGVWFMRFPPGMASKGSGGCRSPATPLLRSKGSSPLGPLVADRG